MTFSKIKKTLSVEGLQNLKNILPKETLNLFILIFTIDFLMSASFCLIRNIRLAMVVTGSNSGSELIPYIQFWIGLPSAFIMVAILARLSRSVSPEKVFYVITTAFVAFFMIFALIIFPARYEVLQMLQTTQSSNPFILMFEMWDLTAYYVVTGLWKIIILQVLLWGYINRQILMAEAKKLYSPLMLAGAIGGAAAGTISEVCSQESFVRWFGFAGKSTWHGALIIQTIIFAALAIGIMITFSKLAKSLRSRNLKEEGTVAQAKKEKKEKYQNTLSLMSSLSYFIKRPVLCSLGIIVLTSYVAISLCEIIYLNKLREVYPNTLEYNIFLARFSFWSAIGIGVSALFICTPMVKRGKWIALSLITPGILLVTSIIFFFFAIFGYTSWMSDFSQTIFECSPIFIAAIAGAFMRLFFSASKNTILSATKELTFVSLPDEDQLKGKFVIDGIGSRMGNSSASLISQGLILGFGSLDACLPLVAFIAIVFIGLWTKSALQIGKHMVESTVDTQPSPAPQEVLVKQVA